MLLVKSLWKSVMEFGTPSLRGHGPICPDWLRRRQGQIERVIGGGTASRRAEPSRAEPSRAEPSRVRFVPMGGAARPMAARPTEWSGADHSTAPTPTYWSVGLFNTPFQHSPPTGAGLFNTQVNHSLPTMEQGFSYRWFRKPSTKTV